MDINKVSNDAEQGKESAETKKNANLSGYYGIRAVAGYAIMASTMFYLSI